jgi:hypothetical protein
MTITFTIWQPNVPSNRPAHQLALPPFEASTYEKKIYLQKLFPAEDFGWFYIDHLFAYYCANKVQFMATPQERLNFLITYEQLINKQLNASYYDNLTMHGNTIIFNAVGQINVPVVKDFLQSMGHGPLTDKEVGDFCWESRACPHDFLSSGPVLNEFEAYFAALQEKRAIAADNLFMVISSELDLQAILENAQELSELEGDFSESLGASLSDDRKFSPGNKTVFDHLFELSTARTPLTVPILKAIGNTRFDEFHRMLCRGAKMVDLTIDALHTAFATCEMRSSFATVLLMQDLSKLLDPHPLTGDRLTHLAAKWGDFELLKLLIEWGGDPAAANNDGMTVLALLPPEKRKEATDIKAARDERMQLTQNRWT